MSMTSPSLFAPPGNASIPGGGGPLLDSPPPRPPLGQGPVTPTLGPGLNSPGLPPSPPIRALAALKTMEKASAELSSVLPGLNPMIADVIDRLRQTVPRALAELAQGSSLPAGAGHGPIPPMMSQLSQSMSQAPSPGPIGGAGGMGFPPPGARPLMLAA